MSAVTSALGSVTGKFIVCLFASYLVGLVNAFLPRGIARHIWLAVNGMVACAFVFGAPWMLLAASVCIVYVLLLLASLIKGTGATVLAVVAAVAAFDIMFSRHIVRAGASAVGLDDCAAQMVMFLKLAHLCFAVADGAGNLEGLKAQASANTDGKPKKALFAKKAAIGRLTRALSFVPSIHAVLGYCFNPTTAMAGPAFDFSVYTIAQDGLLIKDGKPSPLSKAQAKRLASAWSLPRALFGLAFGVVLMALFSIGSGFFPVDSLFDTTLARATISSFFPADNETVTWLANVVSGADTVTHPVVSVAITWGWLSLIQLVVRLQYYGSWIVAEGASATAGLGLDPAWVAEADSSKAKPVEALTTGDHFNAFAKANNIDPVAVETATEYKTAINQWNKHTQAWLAESIFKRAPTAFGFNNHATFVVSALWHGVFPGYFLSLPVMAVAVPAMTAAHAPIKGFLEAVFGSAKQWGYLGPIGWMVRWFFVVGLLNYFMAPFMLLDLTRGLQLLSRTYYFAHVYILICIVASIILPFLVPKAKTAKAKTE